MADELGVALREWRLQARLSQRDLALRIGFHESAVSSIERGERAPSAQYLAGFITALRLDTGIADAIWLLYRSPPGSVPAPVLGEQAPTGVCPYRGLLAFREEDARLYHGRDDAVGRIVRKLEHGRLVGVVGASGSGKSSAVFAGVIPRLHRASSWDVFSMRPGADPFAALARCLRLRSDGGPFSAREALAAIEQRAQASQALLVIDQFEELFTHASDGETVAAFLGVVVGLSRLTRAMTVSVVLTFRGDFYGRLIAHRDISDALQDSVVHLPPMTRSELRQAVAEPARLVGLALEPGLVERILDDAGDEPGNLPLLEFALTRLWEQQRGPVLTHGAYEQIGGLAGAITARAEDVYRSLSPEEQYAARQLLVRLVQVARPEEDGNDARRRTSLTELTTLPRVAEVVQALADARLIVTDAEGVDDASIELAHEAIIRSWDRLRGWLVEDRQFLLWQQRARQWMDEWHHTADSDDALLRGAILDEAREWLSVKGRDWVGADLLAFLDASVRESDDESRRQIATRIEHLLSVRPREVPAAAEAFSTEDSDLHAALRHRLADARPMERWRIRIALLPADPDHTGHLIDELDRIWPDELVAVRDAIRPYRDAATDEKLWNLVAQRLPGSATVLYAAILLADSAPEDVRWHDVGPQAARQLVAANQLNLRYLVDALRPARAQLIEPLYEIFADTTERRAAVRETTATILLNLAADQPTVLARMAADALPQNYEEIYAALERALSSEAVAQLRTIVHTHAADTATEEQRVTVGQRRAAALSTLLRLGEKPDLDALLAAAPDPELLNQLTFLAEARRVPVDDIIDALSEVTDPRARYGLLLTLGEYEPDSTVIGGWDRARQLVHDWYANDDDPGVHAATAWLIRRWNAVPPSGVSAAYDLTGRRGWFTVNTGIETPLTFVVFRPGRFTMGSPPGEAERSDYESPQQDTTITRSFALCDREVTRAEFEAFMEATATRGLPNIDEWSPLGIEPVVATTWFEAVSYADWINAQTAGRHQRIPNMGELLGSSRVQRAIDGRERAASEFRLPTEAEWEYACRAGTTTAYSFGSDRTTLRSYGWYADNSGLKTYEAGLLRPNPAGLFSIHGQCWEWCLDWYAPYHTEPVVDPIGPDTGDRKVLRGGCWNLGARYARSACRNAHIPSNRNYYITFRLAMTLPEIDPSSTPEVANPLPWSGP